MSIRNRLIAALVIAGIAATARADGIGGIGAANGIGNGIGTPEGIGGKNASGGGGGGCTQGSLDFNTNCNTVYAGH
jgi:hypothetical protein